jgi:hypothetical protein
MLATTLWRGTPSFRLIVEASAVAAGERIDGGVVGQPKRDGIAPDFGERRLAFGHGEMLGVEIWVDTRNA